MGTSKRPDPNEKIAAVSTVYGPFTFAEDSTTRSGSENAVNDLIAPETAGSLMRVLAPETGSTEVNSARRRRVRTTQGGRDRGRKPEQPHRKPGWPGRRCERRSAEWFGP